jgi:phospholipid transport system substrate-binding protein
MFTQKFVSLKRTSFLVITSLLVSIFVFSAPASAMKAPEEVVKETVDMIVKNIQANRDVYESDNQKLYSMVDSVLVPTIHVDRMANLILGRENSLLATEDQKKQFANEFKTFLMRSYATALLEYTGNEKVVYDSVKRAPEDDKVTINAKLIAADGQSYPISLFMSNRRDTQWRAYNIEVANINFVGTYRATFGDIIARKGIQGLISELRTKNEKNTPLDSTS